MVIWRYTYVINKNGMTGLTRVLSSKNGLLGICVGLLMLLPACGSRKLWVPEQLTKSNAHYISEQDGVTLAVRRLEVKESNTLFCGRGHYLFRKPTHRDLRFKSYKQSHVLLMQIMNNSDKSVRLSCDGLSIDTLGSQEVYEAICKNSVGRGFGWGYLSAAIYQSIIIFGLYICMLCAPDTQPALGAILGIGIAYDATPIVGVIVGTGVGLAARSDNNAIKEAIDAILLDHTIDILPGQTVQRIIAAPFGIDLFELAIPDLGSDQMVKAVRKFEINLETKSL